MKKLWFLRNPELLYEIKDLVLRHYPTLHVIDENNKIYLRGSLYVFDLDNKIEIDRYSIEIELPDDYPKAIPLIRETGDRIPKIIDRHFIPETGTACLFLFDERYKFYPEGSNIIDFIKIPVYNFFLSQTYFDLTGKWLFGERGHGANGILEYYSEELRTRDVHIILKFLEYLSKVSIKGHWACFCGSGKVMRNCHYNKLVEMREKIPILYARNSYYQISNQISNRNFGQ